MTTEKDQVLEKLERMLENMSENSKQPVLDLINKRKVELGLVNSELPIAGYKLKKDIKKPKPGPKQVKKESSESLRKIAMKVGTISETKQKIFRDIDIKDEPLKKQKKPLEEVDSYKF